MLDILNWINQYGNSSILFLIFGTGLIQLSPIKINPWTTFITWIGKLINGELIKKVDKIQSDLTSHIKEDEDSKAMEARQRILRFDSELLRNSKFSREDWAEQMRSIDKYRTYCEKHPEFKNSYANDSIKHICDEHQKALSNNDFL